MLSARHCNAAGGLAGLKELTDDLPYFGYGNRWDSFPQVADGGGKHRSPTSSSAFHSGPPSKASILHSTGCVVVIV
ncbi:unnamed protein product [Toxocara canis]|uniref:Uncharacterized protein n=1 Tax=Toxocara canis TaxID=6265 RepID=A0A183V863_TOXCA|nr:unnamed protein product [Toxocara canis]